MKADTRRILNRTSFWSVMAEAKAGQLSATLARHVKSRRHPAAVSFDPRLIATGFVLACIAARALAAAGGVAL